MKTILSIDTSTEACSAALLISDEGKQSTYDRFKVAPQKHTQLILPMIDELLAESSVKKSELDLIAFGRGPGAFTGLRIAAGIAQGISMAEDIPVIPVSSLKALALQAVKENSDDALILSAIDARMGEIYWGLFEWNGKQLKLLDEENLSNPDILLNALNRLADDSNNKQIVLNGSGWSTFSDGLEATFSSNNIKILENTFPRASEISLLALDLLNKDETVLSENAQPIYLRNNVAKKQNV